MFLLANSIPLAKSACKAAKDEWLGVGVPKEAPPPAERRSVGEERGKFFQGLSGLDSLLPRM